MRPSISYGNGHVLHLRVSPELSRVAPCPVADENLNFFEGGSERVDVTPHPPNGLKDDTSQNSGFDSRPQTGEKGVKSEHTVDLIFDM
jgi:hypothetical protein